MSHNPNQVLMGSTTSNHREVSNYKGEIEAGLAVRLKGDGTIGVDAPGGLLGISLGRDLSRTNRTAVCREGMGVPIKIAEGFNPSPGDAVFIDDATGEAVAQDEGTTAVNAQYASGRLVGGGIPEGRDKTPVDVALIDFPGGL